MIRGINIVFTKKQFHIVLGGFYFSIIIGLVDCFGGGRIEPIAAGQIQVSPRPKHMVEKGFLLTLDEKWSIVCETNNPRYLFSAHWLGRRLEITESLKLQVIPLMDTPREKRIVLGNPKESSYIESILKQKGLRMHSFLGEEGYVLDISESPIEEIIIAASSEKGVFYGVQTLLQLIKHRSVQGVYVVDYPDHHIRAVDLYFFRESQLRGTPPRFLKEHREEVDKLAGMKINAVSIYTGWDFSKPSASYHEAYMKMVDYCRERFIEVIPGVGNLRSIELVPFYLIEGWWVRDEVFQFNDKGLAMPERPPVNLIPAGGIRESIREPVGESHWEYVGDVTLDRKKGFKGSGSLQIKKGRVQVMVKAEPNSFYHLSALAEGGVPVICLTALDSKGKKLYSQCDYSETAVKKWRKFGVILATDERVSTLRVTLTCKDCEFQPTWFDDIDLRRLNGALQNVIRTRTTDIEITSLDKSVRYIEGIDYKIIDGETSKLYDQKLRPFQIQRLDGGRISTGEKVLISYDCVLYWALSNWYNQPPCVSDERIYTELYFPALNRVIEKLRPKIIFLHSDEIRGFNRDSRNRKRGMTNAELFSEWINKLNLFVKLRDPHCRLMIWDDMVSPYHSGKNDEEQLQYGGSPGKFVDAIEKNLVPKDMILNIWWYSNKYYLEMVASTQFFESRGFDYLGACWYDEENIRSWTRLLFKRPRSLGGFATNWGRNNFPAFARYFWNMEGKFE